MNRNKTAEETPVILLRPHHGICLAFFEGKGYSDGFTVHMGETLKRLQKNPYIRLVLHTDEICSACPNNKNGTCVSDEKVLRYDRMVLKTTGFSEEQRIPFAEFAGMVQEDIIEAGHREEICGDCEWNTICRRKEGVYE